MMYLIFFVRISENTHLLLFYRYTVDLLVSKQSLVEITKPNLGYYLKSVT